MSALPPKADMLSVGIKVCKVPRGHVRRACFGWGNDHTSAHRLGDGASGTNSTQAFARSIHGSLNIDASAGVFDHHH